MLVKNQIINVDNSTFEDDSKINFNSLPENSLMEQMLIVKKNSEIVRDLNAPFYFAKTFPWLFPYGSGSISGNHLRKIKISRLDWFEHVINLGYEQKYVSKHPFKTNREENDIKQDDDNDIIMSNTVHFKKKFVRKKHWIYPFQNDKLFGLIGYTWLSKQRCCKQATTGFNRKISC